MALALVLAAVGFLVLRRRGEHGAGTSAAASATVDMTGSKGPHADAPADPLTAPRANIAGRITDSAGNGIAGATVCATGWSPLLSRQELRDPSCVTSGADGHYAIPNLLALKYGVNAGAPHFIPNDYEKDDDGTVDLTMARAATGIDIALEPGAVEVRGHVKDLSGGVVAGALVFVDSFVTKSDDQGEFLGWAKAGKVSVSASAEGYGQGTKRGVAPGQTFEILLTPEAVLVGRVIEAGSGAPVEGAIVSTDNGAQRYGGTSARTEADGRFRLERLEPGRYKPIAEALGRYGEAKESVLLGLGQTSAEVIIEVIAVRTVTGRVLIAGTPPAPCVNGGVSLHDRVRGLDHWAPSDASGDVQFRAVRAGTYDVKVYCREQLADDKYPEIVVADQDVSGQEWTVRSGLAIRGVVVDTAGAPIDEASVRGEIVGGDPRGQRPRGWDTTKKDGAFALHGLIPGRYRLSAAADDRPTPDKPPEVELTAGADLTDVKIVLDAGSTLEGSVVDEDGLPVADIEVRARGPSNDWWRNQSTTRDDGTFTIAGITPGDYRVYASRSWSSLRAPGKSDDDAAGERVAVKVGQTSRVRLVVERQSGEIQGAVLDEAGRVVTDAFVDAVRESDSVTSAGDGAKRNSRWSWSRTPALTDVDGRFTVKRLSPGVYTVRAFRKGGGEAFAEHVKVGATVTLTIPVTGSLQGSVLREGGATPEEFTISVADRKTGFEREEHFFRTNGAFAMRDLPAGAFDVSANGPDGDTTVQVALADGEQKQGLVLQLVPRAIVRGQAVALADGAPVPGLRVMVRATKGSADSGWGDDGNRNKITDATGHFEVDRAPVGKAYVMLMPIDWEGGDYESGWSVLTIVPGVNELPPIKLIKKRVKPPAQRGDLGFALKQLPADTEPDAYTYIVALVRPDGPAVKSGLRAGDTIVSVDGYDVTGPSAYLFHGLLSVLEGTTITLGLARGDKVTITAAKPR